MALLAAEARARERLRELGRDGGPDDAGAQAQHVAVIVADALRGRVVVVADRPRMPGSLDTATETPAPEPQTSTRALGARLR